MKNEYKNADIVTFISTYEGFGIPVIESQAMGKAVITSDIEPMKSIVGDKGCKVDPYNIGEIKRTIVRIINDEKYRDELIENGIVNSEPYKAKHIAQRYKAVYKNTLKCFFKSNSINYFQ
jgi:glycosyltransferase involved in cell wall biosynthesis